MEVSNLEHVSSRGFLSGLGNLVRMETGRWIETYRWLTNSLVYLTLFQGLIFLVVLSSPYKLYSDMGLNQLVQLAQFIPPIGAIVILQNEVIKEKELGTLAWLLTNPVTRSTVIVAKYLVNIPWVLAVLVVIQWSFSWQIFPLFNQSLPSLEVFLASMGVNMLYTLFYICLTIMIGCFGKNRGAVIGIPFLGFLAQFILERQLVERDLLKFLPHSLNKLMMAWAYGIQADFLIPVLSASICCVLFVAVSIWMIRREQF
jgi:ABC-2 type transport system permease protein